MTLHIVTQDATHCFKHLIPQIKSHWGDIIYVGLLHAHANRPNPARKEVQKKNLQEIHCQISQQSCESQVLTQSHPTRFEDKQELIYIPVNRWLSRCRCAMCFNSVTPTQSPNHLTNIITDMVDLHIGTSINWFLKLLLTKDTWYDSTDINKILQFTSVSYSPLNLYNQTVLLSILFDTFFWWPDNPFQLCTKMLPEICFSFGQ